MTGNVKAFDAMLMTSGRDVSMNTGFELEPENFLYSRALKLDIPDKDIHDWMSEWFNYSRKVRKIESGDRKYQSPEESSAEGVYQFITTEFEIPVDPGFQGPPHFPKSIKINPETGEEEIFIPKNSVETARQRAFNLGVSSKYIKDISDNPNDWHDDQADVMFLANIAAAPGSDQYFIDVGYGKNQLETYYLFHHTKPDAATIDRAEKYLGE